MKLYILNHFVGGTPMDGGTIGVFDTLHKAQKCLQETLKEFEITKEDCEDYLESYVYWDLDDFWGGLEIVVMELNKTNKQ